MQPLTKGEKRKQRKNIESKNKSKENEEHQYHLASDFSRAEEGRQGILEPFQK